MWTGTSQRHWRLMPEIIGEIVRTGVNKKEGVARIASWAKSEIEPAERQRFIEVAENELMSLHEGNFARYQIRPSEFEAWQEALADAR